MKDKNIKRQQERKINKNMKYSQKYVLIEIEIKIKIERQIEIERQKRQ